MIVYLDTSFLAPLFLREATSEAVEAVIAALPSEALTISHWTRVEFASVLARTVRIKQLAPDDARKAEARFDALAQASLSVICPDEKDFDLAKQFIGAYETGLRGGDALHLAMVRNHNAEAIYTLGRVDEVLYP